MLAVSKRQLRRDFAAEGEESAPQQQVVQMADAILPRQPGNFAASVSGSMGKGGSVGRRDGECQFARPRAIAF